MPVVVTAPEEETETSVEGEVVPKLTGPIPPLVASWSVKEPLVAVVVVHCRRGHLSERRWNGDGERGARTQRLPRRDVSPYWTPNGVPPLVEPSGTVTGVARDVLPLLVTVRVPPTSSVLTDPALVAAVQALWSANVVAIAPSVSCT